MAKNVREVEDHLKIASAVHRRHDLRAALAVVDGAEFTVFVATAGPEASAIDWTNRQIRLYCGAKITALGRFADLLHEVGHLRQGPAPSDTPAVPTTVAEAHRRLAREVDAWDQAEELAPCALTDQREREAFQAHREAMLKTYRNQLATLQALEGDAP